MVEQSELLLNLQKRIEMLEAEKAELEKKYEYELRIERERTKVARLLAYTDPFTNCLNRRGLSLVYEYYSSEQKASDCQSETARFLINFCKQKPKTIVQDAAFSQEASYSQGLVLLFDLNGLKFINDNLGHESGDSYIKAFADLIRNFFRSSDLIAHARTGGDEFIVYLPEVNLKSFGHRLDDLTKKLSMFEYKCTLSDGRKVRSDHPCIKSKVGNIYTMLGSCAVGVAESNPQGGDTLDIVRHRADISMYASKEKMKKMVPYSNAFGRARRNALTCLGNFAEASERGRLIASGRLLRWLECEQIPLQAVNRCIKAVAGNRLAPNHRLL